MRDRALLRTTLTLIRTAGSQAHLVRDPSLGFIWRAGSLVLPGAGLNDQAVRDLIDDGWLQKDCIAGTAHTRLLAPPGPANPIPQRTAHPDPCLHLEHQEPEMADYFTSFSCLFDVGSAANVAPARTILAQLGEKLETEEDGAALGFTMQSDEGSGPGMLCLYSEEDGEPEHVIAFVKLCAEAFALTSRWGFIGR